MTKNRVSFCANDFATVIKMAISVDTYTGPYYAIGFHFRLIDGHGRQFYECNLKMSPLWLTAFRYIHI